MALQTSFMHTVIVAFGFGMMAVANQPAPVGEASSSSPIPVCGSGVRHSCVVDGDTLWLNGEKIRVLNIDTPEIKGRCRYERARAIMARDALVELVSNAEIIVHRDGVDRYGRTLAKIYANDIGVGERLIAQGLARRWDGRRRSWC